MASADDQDDRAREQVVRPAEASAAGVTVFSPSLERAGEHVGERARRASGRPAGTSLAGELAQLGEAALADAHDEHLGAHPHEIDRRAARRAGRCPRSSIGPLGRPTPSRRAPQRTHDARAHTATSVTNVSMRYRAYDTAGERASITALTGRSQPLLERGLRRGPRRPEVRRHVGRLDRAHPQRRAPRLATQRAGHRVVVIVSAMSGETNRLLGARARGDQGPRRARDGRHRRDGRAGHRGAHRDGHPGRGRQGALAPRPPGEDPDRRRLHEGAHQGHRRRRRSSRRSTAARSPSSPASRASTTTGNITTLGRGGSDTSAVAVAAAIGADECEIYTDVDGVYTTDPNICPSARKIDRISYEEMLELASLGAKVLQIRSVEIAMKYGVPVHVRSSFNDQPGTIVTKEDATLGRRRRQRRRVRQGRGARARRRRRRPARRRGGALRADRREEHLGRHDRPERRRPTPTRARRSPSPLAKTDLARAKPWIESVAQGRSARARCATTRTSSRCRSSGFGMRSHAGIAAKMFRILANEGINIQAIATSEIKRRAASWPRSTPSSPCARCTTGSA